MFDEVEAAAVFLPVVHGSEAGFCGALVGDLDEAGAVGEGGDGDLELPFKEGAVAYGVGGQLGDEQDGVRQRRVVGVVPQSAR